MTDGTLVVVDGVSKKFCRNLKRSLWYGMKDLASELLARRRENGSPRADEFWALREVSFEVKRGEILGIIGPNGAGKSTLLKILNGLIRPDAGAITVRGRVRALIELGMGFNSVLTGRENIYVNAAVLGIPKETVKSRFEEIVEFSGIGEFIDTPLVSYSSGMKVRLGFSVVLHMDPEVLLVDEVLSVGDAGFVRKAQRAMMGMLRSGISVLLVSHHLGSILALCDRVVWLDRGRVRMIAKPKEAVEHYLNEQLTEDRSAAASSPMLEAALSHPDILVVQDVKIMSLGGNHEQIHMGDGALVTIDIEVRRPCPSLVYGVKFHSALAGVLGLVSNGGQECPLDLDVGYHRIRVRIASLPFREGVYWLSLSFSAGGVSLFSNDAIKFFSIPVDLALMTTQGGSVGSVYLKAEHTSESIGRIKAVAEC